MMIISRPHNSSPSTVSALETPNPKSPASPTFLAETEETPAKTERDPDTLQPADEGDIQTEHSSNCTAQIQVQ
jgi:hypothetical protein